MQGRPVFKLRPRFFVLVAIALVAAFALVWVITHQPEGEQQETEQSKTSLVFAEKTDPTEVSELLEQIGLADKAEVLGGGEPAKTIVVSSDEMLPSDAENLISSAKDELGAKTGQTRFFLPDGTEVQLSPGVGTTPE